MISLKIFIFTLTVIFAHQQKLVIGSPAPDLSGNENGWLSSVEVRRLVKDVLKEDGLLPANPNETVVIKDNVQNAAVPAPNVLITSKNDTDKIIPIPSADFNAIVAEEANALSYELAINDGYINESAVKHIIDKILKKEGLLHTLPTTGQPTTNVAAVKSTIVVATPIPLPPKLEDTVPASDEEVFSLGDTIYLST